MEPTRHRAAIDWQVGVWNRMSEVYVREIDSRFTPVVDAVLRRAGLTAGMEVLDLGTGTGAIAEAAAAKVGSDGQVVGVDISPEMLATASARFAARNVTTVTLREGSGERIPADDDSFDVVLSSLALMYVVDRAATAREVARVLRPGGRLVAAVWAGPDRCDIVRFQQTAGQFAGPPPVPGVGPGALADAAPFVDQLRQAGMTVSVETEMLGFDFPDFRSAWDALAGVTTAELAADQRRAAQEAVLEALYPDGDGPRHFNNLTQFIIGDTAP
jgi:SAM-dependent methyltransferase